MPEVGWIHEAIKKAEILAKKPPLAMSVIKEGLMRGLDFLATPFPRACAARLLVVLEKEKKRP